MKEQKDILLWVIVDHSKTLEKYFLINLKIATDNKKYILGELSCDIKGIFVK